MSDSTALTVSSFVVRTAPHAAELQKKVCARALRVILCGRSFLSRCVLPFEVSHTREAEVLNRVCTHVKKVVTSLYRVYLVNKAVTALYRVRVVCANFSRLISGIPPYSNHFILGPPPKDRLDADEFPLLSIGLT